MTARGVLGMQIGVSIYSLCSAVNKKELSIFDAVREIAACGADCIEFVDFMMEDGDGFVDALNAVVREAGLAVASYSIGAHFVGLSEGEYAAEIARVKAQIDVAHAIGARVMRSDLLRGARTDAENAAECFARDLPVLAKAARELATYAKTRGVMLTVENHGMYVNGADRVRNLITTTAHENYGCTLDIGNCLCVDEDPMAFTKALLPYAKVVHFKDFLIRRATNMPARSKTGCPGWITTPGGHYLRGTIIGDGDVDTASVMERIKAFGFDGAVIIEFEGLEDCRAAVKASLENVRRFAGK